MKTALLGALLGVAATLSFSAHAAQPKLQANVIFILVDDLRYDGMGVPAAGAEDAEHRNGVTREALSIIWCNEYQRTHFRYAPSAWRRLHHGLG